MDPIPNCPKLKWFQVDVFTSRPFGGNPLAVFPEAPGLEGRLMQDIAREMNLSETVFASPARESEWDYEVRIFTPTRELPFAGHPVIGTAHVLLHTRPEGSRPDRLRLKMKAGVVPVEVEHAGQVIFMDQPLPDFGKTVSDMKPLSEALGLSAADLNLPFPAQVVSTGLPALFVPVSSLKSLEAVVPDPKKVEAILQTLQVDLLYAFTLETLDPNATVHGRAFAPPLGIPEDPATGSAAGALGAYLVRYRLLEGENPDRIQIEQGYEMKRPSTLWVRVQNNKEGLGRIRVGGESRILIEGILNVEGDG